MRTRPVRGHRRKAAAGFSLVELMFVAFLVVMLALTVGLMFQKGYDIFHVESAQMAIQRNARRVMQSAAANLRQARLAGINIPNPPNNNQISFDLPIFLESGTACSAFSSVPDGTPPAACVTDADCAASCTTGFCSDRICRRTYTYSQAVNGSIPQLIVSSAGEASRVVGSHIQSITFQDNTMDLNLNANEIRISLAAVDQAVAEKTTQTRNATTVIRIRN